MLAVSGIAPALRGGAMSMLLVVSATACSFDEDANAAHGCDERCAPGMCFLDYCLQTTEGHVGSPITDPNAGTGSTAGVGSGESGTGVSTAGNGSGEAGGGTVPVPPGCMPQTETCNGADDDCDGQVDQGLELGSCEAPGQGTCTTGVLRCQDGVEVCAVAAEPTTESCNGADDDCDGELDEDTTMPCYPEGIAGCTERDDGGFDCQGLCAAGTSTCENGTPGACTGFVRPADMDSCGDAEAADEDCNGEVDDGCPCTGDETQRCYSGPTGTAGIGRCRAGEQRCVNGVFGACEGEVVPTAERCANQGADDNCNRIQDDVFGLGFICFDADNQGVCGVGARACANGSLVCNTVDPAPTETICDGLDEDCDGDVDETFMLATDERNCGACGTRCAAGAMCCGAACRNIASDPQHCGGCGMACPSGTTCCGGSCVATNTVQHCGGCGGCAAGQACCGGACVNTNTVEHCGGCGACGGGLACCDGECVATNTVNHCGGCQRCAGGLACCGGECVALDTPDHCGGCAPCAQGQACCGGVCTDLGSEEHCSSCAPCEGGQACCDGQCVPRGGGADGCGPQPTCQDTCPAPCMCVGSECLDEAGVGPCPL